MMRSGKFEEFFEQRKFGTTVQSRIRKLNPDGLKEGYLVRGLFFEPMSWRRAKMLKQQGQTPRYFRRKGNGAIHRWGDMS